MKFPAEEETDRWRERESIWLFLLAFLVEDKGRQGLGYE